MIKDKTRQKSLGLIEDKEECIEDFFCDALFTHTK